MAEGVARGGFRDARGADGVFHCPRENGFTKMMAAALPGQTVDVVSRGGEHPLPRPFAPGMGVLVQERPGQLDPAGSSTAVVPRADGFPDTIEKSGRAWGGRRRFPEEPLRTGLHPVEEAAGSRPSHGASIIERW